MPLMVCPVADLLAEEVEAICGYGYVNGEVPHPTPAQHAELIALSQKLGRYLNDAEVRSVLCADAAKLTLVTRPVAALLSEELSGVEYVGAHESRPAGEAPCND